MAPKDFAGRWCDLTLGKDAGRDLIEQRLEQVVGGLGDQRDVNVGAFESLREPPLPEGRGFFSLGRVSGLAKGSSCPQNVDRTDRVGVPHVLAPLAVEDGL